MNARYQAVTARRSPERTTRPLTPLLESMALRQSTRGCWPRDATGGVCGRLQRKEDCVAGSLAASTGASRSADPASPWPDAAPPQPTANADTKATAGLKVRLLILAWPPGWL